VKRKGEDLFSLFPKDVRESLHHISTALESFRKHGIRVFAFHLLAPARLLLTQEGFSMGAIRGVPVGGSGTFAESFLPDGSSLPAGSSIIFSYTADDPNVVLTASPDGTSVQAAVPAGDTQGSAPAGQPGSFNISVSGQSAALVSATNSTGTINGGPFNVPILAVAPPPPNLPNALDLTQTA
jgi:hypothetical protein